MKRKLIKQGLGGYTIYLPKKWIDQRNLSQGDEVEVTQDEANLMIGSIQKHVKTEINVEIPVALKSLTRRLIINPYRIGYDKIIIKYEDRKTEKIIKSIIEKDILGFEIISQSKNTCTIETITEPSIENFNNMVNKHFFILKELILLLETNIKQRRKELFQEIDNLILKLNQHANFLRRCISKRLFSTKLAPVYWLFLSNLSLTARGFKFVNKYIKKNKIKPNSDISKLINAIKNILEKLHKLYLKKDLKLIQEIHKMQNKFALELGQKMLKSKKDNEKIIIHYLINMIRMLYHASSPMIMIINH